jgi:hypothetical protein
MNGLRNAATRTLSLGLRTGSVRSSMSLFCPPERFRRAL